MSQIYVYYSKEEIRVGEHDVINVGLTPTYKYLSNYLNDEYWTLLNIEINN